MRAARSGTSRALVVTQRDGVTRVGCEACLTVDILTISTRRAYPAFVIGTVAANMLSDRGLFTAEFKA
jgi:hypothetical protein